MHIQPLYAAPQHAEQVAMWLWQAFGGETLPLPFFCDSRCPQPDAGGAAAHLYRRRRGDACRDGGAVALRLNQPSGSVPVDGGAVRRPGCARTGHRGTAATACDRLCRRLGHPQLYLYSACRDFYERFGWQYIGEGLDYPATAVSLYRYDLSLSDGAITE